MAGAADRQPFGDALHNPLQDRLENLKKRIHGCSPFQRSRPAGPRSSVLQVDLIEKVPQKDDFVRGNGHALAHLLVIRRPFPDVVFRLPVVPADKIEFLGPTGR